MITQIKNPFENFLEDFTSTLLKTIGSDQLVDSPQISSLIRRYNNLLYSCPYSKKGCSDKVNLSSVFDHVTISCKFSSCFKCTRVETSPVTRPLAVNVEVKPEYKSSKSISLDSNAKSICKLSQRIYLIGLHSGEILGWNVLKNDIAFKASKHEESVYSIINISQNRIASADISDNGLVIVWDNIQEKSLSMVKKVSIGNFGVVTLKEISQGILACGTFSGRIVLWEIYAMFLPIKSTLELHTDSVNSMIVVTKLRVNYLISVSTDCFIHIWDVSSKYLLTDFQFIKEHTKKITSIVALDLVRLATSSEDSSIRIWSLFNFKYSILNVSIQCKIYDLTFNEVDKLIYALNEKNSIDMLSLDELKVEEKIHLDDEFNRVHYSLAERSFLVWRLDSQKVFLYRS